MPRRERKSKRSVVTKAATKTRKRLRRSAGLDGNMTAQDGIMAQIEKMGPAI